MNNGQLGRPRFRDSGTRLRPEVQRAFDRIVAAKGLAGTARLLGTTPTVINKLLDGGHATAAAVEKVEAAIASLAYGVTG